MFNFIAFNVYFVSFNYTLSNFTFEGNTRKRAEDKSLHTWKQYGFITILTIAASHRDTQHMTHMHLYTGHMCLI
jgi:hypothetical protein